MQKLKYNEKLNVYLSEDYTMQRGYGKSPNGNNLYLKWVLRDNTGKFIDFDTYRHDLAERNDIRLVD